MPTDDRWMLIKETAADALELPPESRREFIEQACPDAQLRNEVEMLVRDAERATGFLEQPATDLLPALSASENAAARTALQEALGDQYIIEREIGRGGMATVFLARDERHGRRVAIKLVSPESAALESTSSGGSRFQQEISIAAQLNHPHILPLHDSGAAAELLYYIMPHVEGETLRERILREGPLPLHDVVRVLRDVARALAYAHRHGIVHRDIKPANILLNVDGDALVADFGVARALAAAAGRAEAHGHGHGSRHSGSGSGTPLMGTAKYMAPEQAARDPAADHRVDLYSLGVVAYEMIVGAPPFGHTGADELLQAHMHDVPQPVSALRPGVPPWLAELVSSLLAKSPDARPQDAGEVLRQLNRPLTAQVPAAAPTSEFPALRPRRRIIAASAILLLIVVSVISVWRAAPPAAAELAIAILPFSSETGDPDDAPFSAGLTEELTTLLGNVTGLHVVGRRSALMLAGKGLDVRTIADTLGVQFVLGGTVRRDADRLRITTWIARGSDGRVLRSESYEHGASMHDIVAVQEQIARDVIVALALPPSAVTPSSARQVAPTDDALAYELYLKGRHLETRRGRADLYRAAEFFDQVLERDSSYARAHAGLADVYTALALFGYERPHDMYPKARAAAQRAIGLDSTLVEARASLAHLLFVYDFDWEGARLEFQRAIALDPDYALIRFFYAAFLNGRGRFAEGLEQLRIARALDPLAPVGMLAGRLYVNARQPDSAIAVLQEALRFDPSLDLAHQQLGHAFLQKRMYPEAIAALQRAAELSGVRDSAQLAYVQAVAGQRAQAEVTLQLLLATGSTRYLPSFHIAMAHAGLGNVNEALSWLERAYDERASFMDGVNVTPAFDRLRAEPRFRSLMRRMNMESP
ncbi:MAG TPA: protein kinase [Longimicrobiales bacterium]|nr:protein kinase [Longimicrobiales bacterium]